MTNANNTTKNGNTTGSKRGKRRGFTLIEILIVVVILGVLAALVIPGVMGALGDSQKNAAVARASQITTMVTRYNQFYVPATTGATKLTWADNATVSATDLEPLWKNAKYCQEGDIANPAEGGVWVWSQPAGQSYGKITAK